MSGKNKKQQPKAKRLEPTKETLRELFARSGNECAVPTCTQRLIDTDGTFIAQVCHIHAAELGGERFDPEMSNDERRNVSNLLILCYPHHIKTNDVVVFTAEKLRELKAEHEHKYSAAIQQMKQSIRDHTLGRTGTDTRTLARMNAVLNWGLDRADLKETAKLTNTFFSRLDPVPKGTLDFMAIVVERGNFEFLTHSVRALADDIAEACEISLQEVERQVRILEKHGVGFRSDLDEGGWDVQIDGPDWPLWEDLKKFCTATGTRVDRFVVDRQLELLDTAPSDRVS